MNSDLIVFGEDWASHPSSTQHLISHMPGERRLLWVNSIGMRRPRLGLADAKRVVAKLRGATKAPSSDTAKNPFPVVQPIVMPMARDAITRRFNQVMLARSVGGAARKAGLRRPVLWTSLPSAVDAIGAVGESAVVYYCGDDFGALAGVDHKAARNMETELAGRADLILAASPMLAARFPAHKTHLLEHGVDHALFSTPVACAEELSRNAPTAGFYGAIAPWMDVDLIAATARLLPNWNFIFVGPEQTDVSALRACPNVALFGPRPHGELPRFSQHWTAGIIPFRDNAQIRASNPLKLREYLAAGRPIVTTDFPALAPYRAHVTIANTPERFAAALEASMSDMPDAAQRRRASVAGESWSARAALAADLIDRLAR